MLTFEPNFTFNDPAAATIVGIIYNGTCTQTMSSMCPTGSPAGNPIGALTTGTATASNSISETSATLVAANGVAVCAFGSTNVTDAPGLFSGGTITPNDLGTGGGSADTGGNAGLAIYQAFGLSGLQGPWTATLPSALTGDNAAQCISILPDR